MAEHGLPYYYYYNYYCGFCLFLAFIIHVILRAMFGAGKKPGLKLPPGPCQLPLIGSLHHLLGGLPHRRMRDLSLRHGPLMLLRICERQVVVVSSAEAAREVFTSHGTAFEQRPSSPGINEVYSHGMGVVFAPYGEHWRLVRRILMTELLSARSVDGFQRIREDEAAALVSSLASSSSSTPGLQLVNVDERIAEFVADSAVRAIYGDTLPDRAAFLKMMKKALDFSSAFDLRDLFPSSWLLRLLPRSRKAEGNRREVLRLMDQIVRHHEERRAAGDDGRRQLQDMMDVLLTIQKEGDTRVSLSSGVVRAVLMDVLVAALDTSTTTLQWAMAELMANPRVMDKAQSEIRHVLRGQERVRHVALSDLDYLKAVVKETLRLHPPVPFNPRACLDDCNIQEYHVPKGSVIITNVWAISRNPKYWENPDKFMPERFLDKHNFNFKGLDFEFIPFGAGRRICPGMNFAQANIEIALASLLYHFDWELPAGVKPENIDMTELSGVAVKRKVELLLHPIPRIPPIGE